MYGPPVTIIGNQKDTGLKRLIKTLGPGLITGASDDDPSGIATYSQAGAQFGLATLWTALVTFPLMASIQEMCARIGLVTSTGLAGVLKKHYSKPLLYIMILFSAPAIILNIGANIAGVGACANLLFPKIPASFFSVVFTIIITTAIVFMPYSKIAMVLKYICMILVVYLIVPFLYKQHWMEIVRSTIIPTIKFNKEFINMLVAIFGTTMSPYLFFWQATMEVEEANHKKKKIIVDKKILGDMRSDVTIGMFFSNLVMFFIILTTGTVLFQAGIHKIDTVEQAAKALRPLAGEYSYLLFSIGIIGTGFLSIPVLAGCLSYIFSETFGWKEGLDKKFYEARPFYIVIILSLLIGLSVEYVGLGAMKALIYSSVLYGVTAPVIIGIILHICNNKKIMKDQTNKLRSNIAGAVSLLLMSVSAVALIYFQFFSSAN